MLKLLFWLVVLLIAYRYYHLRHALPHRRERERLADEARRRREVVDVEAKDLR